MNFVVVTIVSVTVLGHLFTEESPFDWFSLHSSLNNSSQTDKNRAMETAHQSNSKRDLTHL